MMKNFLNGVMIFLALAFLMGCSHENECTDKCSIRHSNDNYIYSENI